MKHNTIQHFFLHFLISPLQSWKTIPPTTNTDRDMESTKTRPIHKNKSKPNLFKCFKSDNAADQPPRRKEKTSDPLLSYIALAEKQGMVLPTVLSSALTAAKCGSGDGTPTRRRKMCKQRSCRIRQALIAALNHTSLVLLFFFPYIYISILSFFFLFPLKFIWPMPTNWNSQSPKFIMVKPWQNIIFIIFMIFLQGKKIINRTKANKNKNNGGKSKLNKLGEGDNNISNTNPKQVHEVTNSYTNPPQSSSDFSSAFTSSTLSSSTDSTSSQGSHVWSSSSDLNPSPSMNGIVVKQEVGESRKRNFGLNMSLCCHFITSLLFFLLLGKIYTLLSENMM